MSSPDLKIRYPSYSGIWAMSDIVCNHRINKGAKNYKNGNKLNKIIFMVLFASFIPNAILAHPHVFIDNIVTIVFDQNGLAGFKAKWVFDEMFSSMLIHDYDTDKDGKYNPKELEVLKKEGFSNLENYDYFTYIKVNGEEFKVKRVENFSASINPIKEPRTQGTISNKVVYTFFIPCEVLVTSSYKEIKISMFDKTYYVNVALAEKNPVQFEDASSFDYSYKIVDNTKNPYYYGQVVPHEIIFKFRKRNDQNN